MNIRTIVILLLILSCNRVHSQFNPYVPSKLILKSGDTLDRILGKVKKNTFKYKLDSDSKPKKVGFSEIISIEMGVGRDKRLVEYFQVNGRDKYVGVEKIMQGNRLEVYGLDYTYTNTMAGGMAMSGTATSYYVKKKGETKLTFIGDYDAILGEFKIRVNRYFADCEILMKKLETKDIRLRDGFEKIAKFYINNCE